MRHRVPQGKLLVDETSIRASASARPGVPDDKRGPHGDNGDLGRRSSSRQCQARPALDGSSLINWSLSRLQWGSELLPKAVPTRG